MPQAEHTLHWVVAGVRGHLSQKLRFLKDHLYIPRVVPLAPGKGSAHSSCLVHTGSMNSQVQKKLDCTQRWARCLYSLYTVRGTIPDQQGPAITQ